MKKSLSVIVPIYNKEKYLQYCIDSILLCSKKNKVELILINDGSLDNSLKICENNQHNNVVIINNDYNKGPSEARNYGISIATGKYILFLDADDFILNNGVDRIIEWIEKDKEVDLCFLEADVYKKNRISPLGDKIDRNEILNNKKYVLKYLASRPKYSGSACTKIFNRDFLINNQLLFPTDSRSAEDLGFVRDCIMCADNFDKLSDVHYVYRQNDKDKTRSKIKEKSRDGIDIFIKETVNKCCSNNIPKDEEHRYILNFAIYEYIVRLVYYTLNEDDIIFLLDYKWILDFCENVRIKNIKRIIDLFGIKTISKIIILFRKNKRKHESIQKGDKKF